MRKPNVLLISIDTLRADHVSCYGHERETTPALDRLAADGTRFDRAYGTAVWTPPAHGSMLTGLYPTQHGVVDENKLTDAIPTVAELVDAGGYRTLGIVNNSQVGALTCLDRGHATFHEVWRGAPARNVVERGARYLARRMREARRVNDHGAGRTNELAIEWLEAHGESDEPFYAFIHYIEPHNPLGAPRPFHDRWVDPGRDRIDRGKVDLVADNPLVCFTDDLQLTEDELHYIMALYDGEIAYVDSRLGELFDFMRRRGVYDDTLIIVTADHGEHFGEHSMFSHVASLYEPIVHVPLIVKFPGAVAPSARDDLVQHVDIVPTILEHAGCEHPDPGKLRGRPLAAAGGPTGHDAVFAEWEGRVPYYVQKRLEGRKPEICERFRRRFSMIRDERHKLILHGEGEAELYDLVADPAEERDIGAESAATLEALRDRLAGWNASLAADAPAGSRYEIDPEIQKHLESLGYM